MDEDYWRGRDRVTVGHAHYSGHRRRTRGSLWPKLQQLEQQLAYDPRHCLPPYSKMTQQQEDLGREFVEAFVWETLWAWQWRNGSYPVGTWIHYGTVVADHFS